MNKLFTFFFLSISLHLFSQINIADSSAQVISYWNKNEKQSYSMSLQKIKVKKGDTTENVLMTYDVDVTVIDSSANAYLIEWWYKNYKTNSKDEIVKKIASASSDIKVLIETDEFGAIKGVKNWKEVSDYMKNSLQPVKNDFKSNNEALKILNQLESIYTSKEGVESAAILDAQQFHTYHGGKYILGDVMEGSIKVPNLYNQNNPFDTKVTLYLDEINQEENNFIIRSTQEIDSGQLIDATFEYLKTIPNLVENSNLKKEDLGNLTNVTNTASRIHGSGWVIYSIQTKITESTDIYSVEERIIEIK